MKRRSILAASLAAIASTTAAVAPLPALSQAFPSRPVTIIVPYAPGGATDFMARVIAPRLGARLGKEVIVDNRAGAGGFIGFTAVANAAPDGHTLLLTDTSFATMAALYPDRRNSTLKRLAPVTIVGTSPYVVAATSAVQSKNLKELIAYTRSRPGKLNFASGGQATSTHLAGEWFKSLTDTHILHIPYRGGGAAIQAQMGNEVELSFLTVPSIGAFVKSGKIKAFAVTSERRVAALPDVPTTVEAGLPQMVAVNWNAVFVSTETPAAIVARLNSELVAVLNMPEVRSKLADGAVDVGADSPEHAKAVVESDITRWTSVIKARNIKPE